MTKTTVVSVIMRVVMGIIFVFMLESPSFKWDLAM
jgi:preprotein translocase subunit YajC